MKDDPDNMYMISHDEHDMPTYTHETLIISYKIFGLHIVGIIDENPEHEKYLDKFLMKEVDVDSKYWISDGQLGGHYRIYDGPGSFTLEYIFKLTIEMAQLIVDNPEHIIAICATDGILYFIGKAYSIGDLAKFIQVKKDIDKHPNRPPTWKIG